MKCNTTNNSVSDRVCQPNATVVGFMGGTGSYPSYEVNYTALNYSETLRLEYDPAKLSYQDILETYWKNAPDPTLQQDDPAYMLRIFVASPQQWQVAEASLQALKKKLNTTIYANIYNASEYEFWKAAEYHQQYFYKSGQRCGQPPAQLTPRGVQ